jgi:hypothetical protein
VCGWKTLRITIKPMRVPPIWRGLNIHEIPWANGFRIVLGFVLFHKTFINILLYIYIHMIYINIIFHQINHPYSLYPWTVIGFELLTVWITSLRETTTTCWLSRPGNTRSPCAKVGPLRPPVLF